LAARAGVSLGICALSSSVGHIQMAVCRSRRLGGHLFDLDKLLVVRKEGNDGMKTKQRWLSYATREMTQKAETVGKVVLAPMIAKVVR
jgi:hypothetical protein